MDKILNYSFIRPRPIKVTIPHGPKIKWATGEQAQQIMDASLAKADVVYEKIRNSAVALFTPLDDVLPSKIKDVRKVAETIAQGTAVNVTTRPLYIMLTAILNDTDFISSNPQERVMWYMHCLSIIKGETGVLMDPKLESKGSTVFQGRRLPYHVYGAFQQTPANWDNAIVKFQDSSQGKALMASGVMKEVAFILRIPFDHLKDPAVEYGAKYMPEYQLVPILGQLLGLKQSLGSQFTFDKTKGWQPKNAIALQSANWKYLQTHYKYLMLNYYGGRQALLTLMHINGTGFLTLEQVGNHMERIQQDVRCFAGLLGEKSLRATIEEISRTYDIFDKFSKMLNIHGDPTDPTEESVKKKKKASTSRTTSWPYSKFGWRTDPYDKDKKEYHPGLDVKVKNSYVHAVSPGTVYYAQFNPYGYGNNVRIKHDNGYETRYAHLSKIDVKSGEKVFPGTILGKTGNTGHSKGEHLHFEVVLNNKQLDPLNPTESPFDLDNLISKA